MGCPIYLKALELENFKSFGRSVAIPFGRGYTGVTGPNGSGKSNISDAILFVLGPKSGRVIRAGRLTDLIFNGGREGRAASHCSASLVFDNQDRMLPVDADEVRLTRVVRLSTSELGYNSYFYINDRRASLAEFDALLLHSNISADGYNIVQQGDVARMVSMTPLERRRVLEQVAGIGKYDEDIQRAQGERAKVEENLQGLAIVLGEIKTHLKALEKDRTQAQRYQGLQADLDRARGQLALRQRDSLLQQVGALRAQISKHEAEGLRLEEERGRQRVSLGEAQARLDDLERRLTEAGGPEARQVKERLDHLRIERARTTDALQATRDALGAGRREEATLARDLAQMAREVAVMETQSVALDRALAEAQASLQAATEEVQRLEGEAGKSDEKVEALQGRLAKATAEVEGLRQEHHRLTVEGDRARQVTEVLEAEVARLEEARKELLFELQDAEFHLKEARGSHRASSGSVAKLQERFMALRREAADLDGRAASLEAEVKRLTREYERLRAEVDARAAAGRGGQRALGTLLEARDTGQIKGIVGTIEELGTMEEKYRVALEVAAGPRLQALVVKDDAVAAEAIEVLKRSKLGRATFLPLNRMLPGYPRGKALMVVKEALGFAIDLVKFDEAHRGAFWYVFGDTIVVRDLGEARRLMGGVRLVTLDGQLIEASGAMVGGSLDAPGAARGPSRGQLDEAGAALRAATAEADVVAARRGEVASSLTEVEEALREASGASEVGKSKGELMEARVREAQAKLQRLEQDLGQRKAQWNDARKPLPALQADRTAIEERLGGLSREVEEVQSHLARATPRDLARALRDAQAERAHRLEEATAAQGRRGELQARLELLQGRRADAEARRSTVAQALREGGSKLKDQVTYLAGVEEELGTLAKVEESLGAQHAKLRTARDEAFRTRAQAEADLDRLQARMESRQDLLAGLRTEAKVQEASLAAAEEELARHAVDTTEAPPSMELLRTTIAKLQASIDALGPVNLRALEDFETQARRHEELTSEVDRLKGERQGLVKLVDELNGRKRQGLLAVFAAIDENFHTTYAELSEGGEAELELEDPRDPFQGGLVMRVKPPHKRALRLEALSGGEKGLVSMAFIFALQRYNPSPFYLLDEVDQNLDAINAERVARALRRNADRAQFIQVSLRKVSLKEADHLLGVTMGPRGQSEVILKLDLGRVPEETPSAEGAEA